MATLENMIQQAVNAEKKGELITFWRATDAVAIAVCKIEGHQWQISPMKDAICCSRCDWAVGPKGGFK